MAHSDGSQQECVVCNAGENCVRCQSSDRTECTQCVSGYHWLDGRCVASCPDAAPYPVNATNRFGHRIRLVNGSSAIEGRVEVFHAGIWGTVCGDHFSIADADVICRHVGLRKSVSVERSGVFGESSALIWLKSLRCTGGEERVHDCPGFELRQQDCLHSHDVGVHCEGPDSRARCVEVCPRGSFFHLDRCLPCSENCADCTDEADRCEECHADSFRYKTFCVQACPTGWFGHSAMRQCLPCNGPCLTCSGGNHGNSCTSCAIGYVLNDGKCIATSSSSRTCADTCGAGKACITTSTRLRDHGTAPGAVEVYHDGQWGGVCSTYAEFSDTTAEVVCRELGLGAPLNVISYPGEYSVTG